MSSLSALFLLACLLPLSGGKQENSPSGAQNDRKLVALVPVRDEAHLLPSCLRALVPLVDAIVVLDDCSTDGSGDVARALARECKVERVARTPNCPGRENKGVALPYWGDEAQHRGLLLDLGRSVGGTHFLAIDADEAIVVETEEGFERLKRDILGMAEADLLVLPYVTMYGSAKTFRRDKGDMKAVGFGDQPGASYQLPPFPDHCCAAASLFRSLSVNHPTDLGGSPLTTGCIFREYPRLRVLALLGSSNPQTWCQERRCCTLDSPICQMLG